MEQLIRDYQALMDGLIDLSNMMASENPGSGYVQRLAAESERYFVKLLIAVSEDGSTPKDTVISDLAVANHGGNAAYG